VASVHPSAVVEPGAELGEGVVVGPFCHVAGGVQVGARSVLTSHVTLLGPGTSIGRDNRVFPGAVIGAPPQDKSHQGEPTRLEVGDENEIREQVTLHRGTVKGGGVTRVGSRCLLMVGAHVAHDCLLGDDVVLSNLTTLGGHVVVESHVVCGGHVAVQPFVRLGRGCFLAGGARVERDVPPFVIAAGDRARVRALNAVGLERMGVPPESRALLEQAFRLLFRRGQPLAEGMRWARASLVGDPWVNELLAALGGG
jgi:UDP-N-acetylglucosamine acyltransferase